MNKNTIQALVIGKSGHGKSEFILSFIKDEQRSKIPASGEGQTTRTSMEYNILNNPEQSLKINVCLKTKANFISERIAGLNNFFVENEDYNRDSFNDKSFIDDFYKLFVMDEAFFSINEFSESTRNAIENAYKDLFEPEKNEFVPYDGESEGTTILDYKIVDTWYDESKKLLSKEDATKNEEFIAAISQLDDNSSEKTAKYQLIDLMENFCSFVYDKCFEELDNYIEEKSVDLKDISDLDEDEISKFLKTQDGKISFSSLVHKVYIESALTEQYKELFTEMNIEKITLVDTYGLDHAEQVAKNTLVHRYENLFRQDYPQISSVFYLRNIANTDSPSELKLNIPTIFEVSPEVVSFIVFTYIDKLDSTDISEKKAFKNIEEICTGLKGIKSILRKQNVSEVLIDNRIELLKKSRYGYASKLSEVTKEKRDQLSEVNLKTLSGILKSIINKEHLGTQLISIDKLIGAKTTVLKGSDIFQSGLDTKFTGWPGRTLGAIRSRLQNGILGFDSSTMDSTLWSDVISDACNKRFTNMTKAYKWSEYFGSENVLPTLEELFVEFSKKLQLCANYRNCSILNYSNDHQYCKDCSKKDVCIKSIFYTNKKDIIDGVYYPISKWLTVVYCFSSCADNIDDALSNMFDMHLIDSARAHNARCLAKTFSENDTHEDIQKKYNDFFNYFDSKLNEDERMKFKCSVNSYII